MTLKVSVSVSNPNQIIPPHFPPQPHIQIQIQYKFNNSLVFDKGAKKSAGGPVKVDGAKIGLIQFCLSAPKTDMENNVVVSDYAAMDRILREERKFILGLCKKIKKSGCNVLLIQKSILRDAYNELSLHFLAKMDIMVVTDIERTDVEFIARTLGCQPVAHIDSMTKEKLGFAENVGEVSAAGSGHKVVKMTGVKNPGKTMTVLLRGSNKLVLAEADRSVHDAQCVVRSLVKKRFMIAGGGAAETEVSERASLDDEVREMATDIITTNQKLN